MGPHDRVIALGPPHAVQVYDFYLGDVDYFLGRATDRSFYRISDGKLIERATGARVLGDLEEMKALLEHETSGSTWILADRPLLAPGTNWYSQPVMDFLAALPMTHEYTGLDGQTFAAKVAVDESSEIRHP